jgi:hypothetical protein
MDTLEALSERRVMGCIPTGMFEQAVHALTYLSLKFGQNDAVVASSHNKRWRGNHTGGILGVEELSESVHESGEGITRCHRPCKRYWTIITTVVSNLLESLFLFGRPYVLYWR